MTTNLAVHEARARAGRIREGIRYYLSTLAEIAEAYKKDDWRTLGYADWTAYVDGEFGQERLKLSRDMRQKAIVELRLAGLSQRAIGSVVGVNRETVATDLKTADQVAGNQPPEAVTGRDGKTYPSTRPETPAESRPEPEEPAQPEPKPQKAKPSAVKKIIDEDPDVQAADFMRRFAGALVAAGQVYTFPAQRVAELADDVIVDSLERHADLVAGYLAEVQSHRPTRLRLVKGA